jgi:hypothetical protein
LTGGCHETSLAGLGATRHRVHGRNG